MEFENLYKCADFFLGRTSLFPSQAGANFSSTNWVDFIEMHPDFLEAISIASPNLCKSLYTIKDTQNQEQKVKKVYQSLLKYLLRMTYRATPFGAFSFVWWGEFHEKTALNFDSAHIEKKALPDMEWVHAIIDILHTHADFVYSLKVMCNPLVFQETGRYLLKKVETKNKSQIISIKETTFTKEVFKLSQQPLYYRDLEDQLFKLFAQYDKQNTVSCLWDIFRKGFLTSELFFPIHEVFEFDQFVNLIFSRSQHIENSEIKAMLNDLQKINVLFADYSKKKLGKGIPQIKTITDLANQFDKNIEYPLHVVSHLKKQKASLPKHVQKTIEETAEVLFLLTYHHEKMGYLDLFLKSFHEKYGMNRLVPIRELMNPISGLVIPKNDQKETSQTNKLIHSLLFDSLAQQEEVDITILISKNRDLLKKHSLRAPPSLELYFEILADSPANLDGEDYTLILNPLVASTQAGSTFGRFLYFCDDSSCHSLRHILLKEEALNRDVAYVEVSFPPPKPRTLNVSYHKSCRTFQLNLCFQNPNESIVDLDDIFVGVREKELYLYSKKLCKEIKFVSGTAVNTDLAPPIVKLMLDISEKSTGYFSPCIFFDFLHVAYTPRIRYKNVILSPARWYFNYENLKMDPKMSPAEVEKILRATFENRKLAKLQFLTEYDNRLLVDWEQADEFKLIVDHFMSKKEVILYECLLKKETSICKSEKGSHVTEFVVPLVRNQHQAIVNSVYYPETQQLNLDSRIKCLGQSDWLFVKIFLPQELTLHFINIQLKVFIQFLKDKGLIDKWFYVRYHEEMSHVRLRLHGPSDLIQGEVFQALGSWCKECIFEGVISDYSMHNYEREIERYGGPFLIDAIEDFFHQDSNLCSLLIDINQKKQSDLPLECLAALGISQILKNCYQELDGMIEALHVQENDLKTLGGLRTELKTLIKLLSLSIFQLSTLEKTSEKFSYLTPVFEHFNRTNHQVAELSYLFDTHNSDKNVWNHKNHWVNSLVHMHCNRLLGIDPELEKKARAIVFYCLKNLKMCHHL